MKIQETTTYRCDFCNKLYLRKKACATHEIRCNKNPLNDRKCFECKYRRMKESKIDTGLINPYNSSEIVTTVSAFYCDKLEVHLRPPISEHKNKEYDFLDYENVSMKTECEFYEEENLDIGDWDYLNWMNDEE